MANDERKLLEVPDRSAWRSWLGLHAAASSGVWLAVGKKGNRVTTLTYDDAVEEALCFGWIDSTTKRLDDDRYKQLFTPRRPNSTWSPSNKARVARLTAEGLMTAAGLHAIEVAKQNGSWTLLDEIESMVVPEDFAEALASAPGATPGFEKMTASERKMVLYWIATAKRPETRARRIARAVTSAIESRMPM